MNPIVVNAVSCPDCNAKIGEECCDLPEFHGGGRLHKFIEEAPYQSRLALHKEMIATFNEMKMKNPSFEFDEYDTLCLTDRELKKLKKLEKKS